MALALFTVGCGSSSSNGAKIRLVNGTLDENSIDLLVDSKGVVTGVDYGRASAYVSVDKGSRELQVEPSGSTTAFIDQTVDVAAGANLSLFSLNFASNGDSMLLTDDNSAPTSGNFKLRVVNASPGMGAQDVYVVSFDTDITTVPPTFPNLGFGSAAAYSTLAPGNYKVVFTQPNENFNVTLDSGSLSFSAGQVRTVVALNNPAGAFLSTVLVDAN